MRNVAVDVRSVRLLRTVQATFMLWPDVPRTTSTRVVNAAKAVRMLVEADDYDGTRRALDRLEEYLVEAKPELGDWADRIISRVTDLRNVL